MTTAGDAGTARATEDASRRRARAAEVALGVAMIVAIAGHDYVHVSEGRYWDVFWVCNVSAAVLGPALLLRSAALAFAAFAWLVPGTLVWLLDSVLAGSTLMPTSFPVHLGGSAATVFALRRFGRSPRGWVAALGVLVVSVAVSRLALPAHANVNAAHAVPRGWEVLGGSRAAFIGAALGIVAVVLAGAHVSARWIASFPLRRAAR